MQNKSATFKSSLSTNTPIDFGALHELAAADDWYLRRDIDGEVFCWLSPWVSRGSTIQFDDNIPIELVPQQPYFINFRKITIHLYSPLDRGFSVFYTILNSDRLQGMVFKNKEFYFNAFNNKQRFMLTISTPSNALTFKLRGFKGDYFRYVPALLGATICSWYVEGDIGTGTLAGQRPAIAWNAIDNTASYPYWANSQIIPNDFGSYVFNRIFNNIVDDVYFYIEYCNGQKTDHNRSILLDYKPNLAAATGYNYYYEVPAFGKDLTIYLREASGTACANLGVYYYLPFGLVVPIATSAGSPDLLASVPNLSGTKVLRVYINTNAALPCSVRIDLALRNA